MIAILPGVSVALVITWLSVFISNWLGTAVLHSEKGSPISPITIAIILGIAIGNTLGVSKKLAPGLDFCVKKLLRLGIILIGLKLALTDVQKLNPLFLAGVPVVIASGLFFTYIIARRLGVSDGLALVTAAATSICGVTAAVSVAPVVEATDEELSYTVANVTLYGLIGMLFYPYLAHAIFGASSQSAGFFLGTSIHDTSQVMGAALSYQQVFGDKIAMETATVTKLTRNVFLVVVVPILAYFHARRRNTAQRETKLSQLFPTFVLGFIAMVLLRTAGDKFWPSKTWTDGIWFATERVAIACLGAALTSVGLTTQLARLRGLGLKPLYMGGIAATLVGGTGMLLAALIGHTAH